MQPGQLEVARIVIEIREIVMGFNVTRVAFQRESKVVEGFG